MVSSRTSDVPPAPRAPVPPATSGPPAPTPRPFALPPALARPVSVLSLVQALRRRWVPAVSLGLFVGVVAAVVSWRLMPPAKYSAFTARSLVRVKAIEPTIVGQAGQQMEFGIYRATLTTLIKSRVVIDEVLRQPHILELPTMQVSDPVDFLRNEIQIDSNLGAEVLRIALSGENPDDLSAIVNAVTNAAIDRIGDRETRDKKQSLEKLLVIQKQYEDMLQSKKERLVTVAKTVGTTENPEIALLSNNLARASLEIKQGQLETVRSRIRETRVQLDQKRAHPDKKTDVEPERPTPTPDEAIRNEAEVQSNLTRIAQLKAEIQHFHRISSDKKAADVLIAQRGLYRELAMLEAAVQDYNRRTLQGAQGAAKPTLPNEPPATEFAGTLEQLERRQAANTQIEKILEDEIEQKKAEIQKVKVDIVEIQELQKDLAVSDDMNKNVKRLLENMKVEILAPERVTLIEKAEPPTQREERRTKFAGLIGLAAFAFTLFGVGFLEFHARRVQRLDDLTHGLEIPVIGTQGSAASAASFGAKEAPWFDLPNDGIDAARALLVQPGAGPASKTVVVTSAVGGEGTSATAANLAASLARAGRRTLLIDANLRKPSAHRPFGLENTAGLSEVLRGETAAAPVIRAAPLDRLWVMTAGQGDLRAVQGLARETVVSLLEQLKRDYEYIVVDTSPVVPTADSLFLAQRADAVILSVLAGVSRMPTVFSGWQRLTSLGARVLGAVMQGASDDTATGHAYPFRPAR